MSSSSLSSSSLVIVGAGPRGAGLIERIAANAPELYDGSGLDIHLVDPHPPGAGRIWRAAQSPLLWMNSHAEDVTMFTDETVSMEGPVREGPTLHEWAGVEGGTFADRQLQGRYLGWFYEEAVAALPVGVRVHRHVGRAVRVVGAWDGRQEVWLEGGRDVLHADLVVLALGHLDAELDDEQRALASYASRHGLVHLPPDFTADSDLSALEPGAPVLVRGFGLAFVDLMVLLTEGRGGRYEGEVYVPSGREPVLYVGSRRGVPYRSKIGYEFTGERPPLPRFLGPGEIDELLAREGGFDYRRDVWSLVEKELGFAHYHRLFSAHPERTAMGWADFEEKYAAGSGADLRALVAEAVPDPRDRLDLAVLDRPLEGARYGSAEEFQDGLRAYIEADLTRRHDDAYSADLAVFLGLLSVYGQLIRLGGQVPASWHGFFSYLASGPPGPRLRQMLALSRAGVLRFVGGEMEVRAEDGVFRASSPNVPGAVVEARALVEARLPEASVGRALDPLLRGLAEEGVGETDAGLLRVDARDGRVLDADGRAHPRRFALGPYTDARTPGAFTRPRTGGPAFRQNDATARAVLEFLRGEGAR
ncbi:FAD/NAD(P)-binding protein [Streptomyces sp. LBUM 1476]|uniref:FAD/NAD(P)-binding protein n=1 Tax=Streptomyces acidiscabies TaxID=42234 RepID=A0AAP6BH13_9ACTN|nr:FAD/NAD(P)-binding protein [Streptomyces acidiscabies]MBP5940555.1 FAD/NAD(P)-binding protein [Streptomyces sp. LBUM 1476]MBZ3911802.1 FAD/NAD(P)-binding protein [Streptomyces acidiscabies]MDX2964605.1 FAD/NAD(P)-binding protein [Streptomyces acidiscabies]MDX3024482.1 FAD/NAD(P)-binding protein [Streptomyces acidiscabies]MDX3794879.1 FAD/NAD(P)-binding protein [Streptomyces acidiscabies]